MSLHRCAIATGKSASGEPVLARYERIAFEKDANRSRRPAVGCLRLPRPSAAGCRPRFDARTSSRSARRGTVLVDERDPGTSPRMLFFLEHAIQDASVLPSGERRTISRRMLYVEMDAAGEQRHLHYAPYLDYRPLDQRRARYRRHSCRPESAWITREVGAESPRPRHRKCGAGAYRGSPRPPAEVDRQDPWPR